MLLVAPSEQYRVQQGIAATTSAAIARVWRGMGDDFDESWSTVRPQAVSILETGRRAAVANAVPYTAAVLAETGQVHPAVGALAPAAFLATAPDGRDIASLLDESVVKAKVAVAGGATADDALRLAGRWMSMVSLTTIADTRRMVYQADIIQRPTLTGYVRMLNMPSCDRCIMLAGKWFRWNEGFQRHPRCDCTHIPGAENVVGDARTDPYLAFKSMSPDEQERVFGRSEARALREGADIYKVVNQKARKLPTANSAIDKIYRNAGTRTNAIRMLTDQGFIMKRGQVVVPLSPGVRTDAQLLAAGRGRGTVTIGGQTVTTGRAARYDAVSTGRRDPLVRSTMTAAERRLYDANYRLQYARRTGNVPRGVGMSSADLYASPTRVTPARLAELEQALAREVAKLPKRGTPESVRRLARALGLL